MFANRGNAWSAPTIMRVCRALLLGAVVLTLLALIVSACRSNASQQRLDAAHEQALLYQIAHAHSGASSAAGATSTPFQPVEPTITPTPQPTSTPLPTPLPTLAPTTTPAGVQQPYHWRGLELDDGAAAIHVTIHPPAQVNGGSQISLSFRTGWPCEYIDHRACLSAHFSGNAVLTTVHSGMGGEGEALRRAMESTGFNRAWFSLAQIQSNVDALRGATVTVEQDGARAEDLRVLAAVRVPASRMAEYFSLPFDSAARMAAGFNQPLADLLENPSGRPWLVIETCGWRHPEEAWAPGVTDTSGAVYLVVIGGE